MMFEKKKIFVFFIVMPFYCNAVVVDSDIAIVGLAHIAKSYGTHTKGFVDCLVKSATVTFIGPRSRSFGLASCDNVFINADVNNITDIESPVVLYTAHIKDKKALRFYLSHDYKGLRVGFFVIDQMLLKPRTITILNTQFDYLLVADQWLVELYKKMGIEIPIFVLPESIDLQPFLNLPKKTKKSEPFIFGCSALFGERKNQELLIDAFFNEFGNDPHVKLVLHGRDGKKYTYLRDKIKQLAVDNITIIKKVFNRKNYVRFFSKLDCYVLLSKEEGFSITPREALAAGLPCIISNNTAHKTICDSGFVCAVPSDICCQVNNDICFRFTCDINDVQKALRNVYSDYEAYLAQAMEGRKWVQQYLPQRLKAKYLSALLPKRVVLGNKDNIVDDGLVTNSVDLYNKYTLLKSNNEQLCS